MMIMDFFGVLIYCDDDHLKTSCGYVITDHNSTACSEREKEMKPIEIKEKLAINSVSTVGVLGFTFTEYYNYSEDFNLKLVVI